MEITLRHYGIWVGGTVQKWMEKYNGDVYYAPCRSIAEAMLKQSSFADNPFAEVKEFPADD